jgi:hypothetical protein
MPLADQILVTGATLLLADVKTRNPGKFDDLDEVALREALQPVTARLLALAAVQQHRSNESADGRRVVGLCEKVAETIERNFPDSS